MRQRLRGLVGGGAAALAAALLFADDGKHPPPPAEAGSRPAASQPQRARLIRLDDGDRLREAGVSPVSAPATASARQPPLPDALPHGAAALPTRDGLLALLVLACATLWLAARRRIAVETR